MLLSDRLLEFGSVLKFGDEDVGVRVDLAKGVGKSVGGGFFAVDNEDVFERAGDFFGPSAQFSTVGMAAEGIDGFDMTANAIRFSEDGDFFVTAGQVGAEGVGGAPADDENGGIGVADVVFDVVSDTTGFGHAGGAEDDAGFAEVVDSHAFGDASNVGEVGHGKRVVAIAHKGLEILVEALRVGTENGGGVDGQRTVHKRFDGRDALVLCQLVERVKNLLGASDGKGGDDDFAVMFQGVVDDTADAGIDIGEWFVVAVAVSAFHHEVVHVMGDFGVAEDVVVAAPNVTAKDEARATAVFFEVEDDNGGTEDVAGVEEGKGNAGEDGGWGGVGEWGKLAEAGEGIGLCVEGLDGGERLFGAFFVDEDSVLFLDVRGVQEHVVTEVGGGFGAMDFAVETVATKDRDDATVVNVGVAEDHGVDGGGIEGEFGAVFDGFVAMALIKAALDQEALAIDFEEVFGAGGAFGGAEEGQFHRSIGEQQDEDALIVTENDTGGGNGQDNKSLDTLIFQDTSRLAGTGQLHNRGVFQRFVTGPAGAFEAGRGDKKRFRWAGFQPLVTLVREERA